MPATDPKTRRLAQRLAARLAGERPDLLPAIVGIIEALEPCQAGKGFRCVSWHGTPYSFTKQQAAVVAVLWAAWKRGVPEVGDGDLLDASGTDAARLVDVFRDSSAWGHLIVPGRKGTHRLGDPPIEPGQTG